MFFQNRAQWDFPRDDQCAYLLFKRGQIDPNRSKFNGLFAPFQCQDNLPCQHFLMEKLLQNVQYDTSTMVSLKRTGHVGFMVQQILMGLRYCLGINDFDIRQGQALRVVARLQRIKEIQHLKFRLS